MDFFHASKIYLIFLWAHNYFFNKREKSIIIRLKAVHLIEIG